MPINHGEVLGVGDQSHCRGPHVLKTSPLNGLEENDLIVSYLGDGEDNGGNGGGWGLLLWKLGLCCRQFQVHHLAFNIVLQS